MTWELASAESRAATHGSFKIPRRAARQGLRVGDFAKLIFTDPTRGIGERMWVEVVAREAGRYRGRLRSVPSLIRDLGQGDLIEFGPEHVADWADERGGGA